MEESNNCPHGRHQPGDVVVGHVLRNVGVIGVDERFFQQAGVQQCCQPHDARATGMDNIRLERFDLFINARRETKGEG